MPRWTPPALAPSSDAAASSCKKQAASSAGVDAEPALKDGLSGEPLSNPSGAPEPVAGPPDGRSQGGFLLRAALPHGPFLWRLEHSFSFFLSMKKHESF